MRFLEGFVSDVGMYFLGLWERGVMGLMGRGRDESDWGDAGLDSTGAGARRQRYVLAAYVVERCPESLLPQLARIATRLVGETGGVDGMVDVSDLIDGECCIMGEMGWGFARMHG